MNKWSKWIVALTVMLPTLIEIVDTSVVNVSLDHIRGSLSAGIDESTWTVTSYLVSNAIIIPMTGWLSKLFGRKNYLIFSIVLFTINQLPQKDIAEAMQCSVEAVKWHVFQGRKKLREILKDLITEQ